VVTLPPFPVATGEFPYFILGFSTRMDHWLLIKAITLPK
jgi:hypothetical protein